MRMLAALSLIIRRQVTHDLFRTTISVGAVASGVVIAIAVNAVMSGFETKFVIRTIEISPHVVVYDDPASSGTLAENWSEKTNGLVIVSANPAPDQPPRIEKPDELIDALRARPEIAAASGSMVLQGIFVSGTREARGELVGIDPDEHQQVVDLETDLIAGTLTDLYASSGVILGKGLAERIGAKYRDFINVRLTEGDTRTMRVVGIIHTGVTFSDLRYAYTLLSVAQGFTGRGSEVNRIDIKLHDFEQALEVAGEIERMVGKRTIAWQDANTHILALLNTNKMLTAIVSLGVLIVAAIGILNVMMMMVMDRVDSIALLRSLGYNSAQIAAAWMGLGLAIGLLGVAVGCSFGYYVVEILGTVPIPKLAVVDTETLLVNNLPRHYLLVGGVATGVSVVAGVLPAIRAARMDPVTILRGRN